MFHKILTEWLHFVSNGPSSQIPGGFFILGKEYLGTPGYYLGGMTARSSTPVSVQVKIFYGTVKIWSIANNLLS